MAVKTGSQQRGQMSVGRRHILRLTALAPALLFAGLGGSVSAAADPAPARSRPDQKPAPKPAASGKPGAKAKAPPARHIMIDPGHGGVDPGALGARGTREKDVTLAIARALAQRLRDRHGVRVTLTRNDDRFIALGDRVERARKAKPDLFVSLHADSAPNQQARGLSAYILSEKSSDGFAAALARQENNADKRGGVKARPKVVRDILVDLTARHTQRASLAARQGLVSGVRKQMRLLDNPMRAANFAVLKAPDVPSLLVEVGFLSNRQDESVLRDATQRRNIASVLAREFAAIVRRAPFA